MTRSNCHWYHEYRDMNMTVPYCEELRIDNPHCENECSCKYYISKDDADKIIRNASAMPSGDLISREEAIAYIDRVTNSGLGRNKSLEYIRKYISALPSAEPSGDFISREEAIDSINKTNSTLDEIPICKDIRSAFANAIKSLPSADRPQDNSAKEKSIEQFLTLLTINALEEVQNE